MQTPLTGFFLTICMLTGEVLALESSAPLPSASSVAQVRVFLDENADYRHGYLSDTWSYMLENSASLSMERNVQLTEMLCVGLSYDEGRPYVLERLSLPPISASYFNDNSKALLQRVNPGHVSDRWLVRAYAIAGLDIKPIINKLNDANIYSLLPADAKGRVSPTLSSQWLIDIYNARCGDADAVHQIQTVLEKRPLEYWGQDGVALMDLVFTDSGPLLDFVKKILFDGSNKELIDGDLGYAPPTINAACALASSGNTPLNYWQEIGWSGVDLLRKYYRENNTGAQRSVPSDTLTQGDAPKEQLRTASKSNNYATIPPVGNTPPRHIGRSTLLPLILGCISIILIVSLMIIRSKRKLKQGSIRRDR